MPYNLLILPICGGYLILIHTYIHKYNYQRLDPQKLLFSSILVGLLLIGITLFLRIGIFFAFEDFYNRIRNWVPKIPIKHIDYLWTSSFTLFIAINYTLCCNFLSKKCKSLGKLNCIKKAVGKHGDTLEKMFASSADEGSALQITLKNGKVYVGFSREMPVPKESKYFQITPAKSGFRDNLTHEIKFTTDYILCMLEFLNDDKPNSIPDLAIKKEEIISATYYSKEVHDFFQM